MSTIRSTFSSVKKTDVVSSIKEPDSFTFVSFRPTARLANPLRAPAPRPAAKLPKLIKRLTRLLGTLIYFLEYK